MLESYFHSCGGWSVACHTTSPQMMIPPPIKRSRILVNDGVVIVISVKLYNKIWLRRLWLRVTCRQIPVSRHPPTRAKSGPVRSHHISCLPLAAFPNGFSQAVLRAAYSDLRFYFLPNVVKSFDVHFIAVPH